MGIGTGFARQEIQQVPLRHEGNERIARVQMREVSHQNILAIEDAAQQMRLFVRQVQQFVGEAQFVHRLQGGGMNGVAAKIAQEVGMFFENDHIDAAARQQGAEHEPGRAAADDAALGGEFNQGQPPARTVRVHVGAGKLV